MTGPASDAGPILDVRGLRLSIRGDEGTARILDHIDFALAPGHILGVVGESGCGKSTVVRAVLGILPQGARVDSGEIRFAGRDLLALGESELNRRIRGKSIGFVPQDPYLALNPVFRIGAQLLEIMRWHAPKGGKAGGRAAHRAHLLSLFRRVQLPDPEAALDRYPHQFSGGQRQRLLIAAALACSPALVVADEPTTALDVTTQRQVLDLLRDLVREFGLSMLFVTHDLGVVAELCDDICVIYAGQSVESGPTQRVLAAPKHPYTRALLACHPDRADSFIGIPGAVPSPLSAPPGCRFAPRCAESRPICAERLPHPVDLGAGRRVDCVLYDMPETVGV
jgi:peptide/nickel transport system ATP-binding protein